jgi:uncharacterized protein YdaU (DUF1376 family)
MHYYQFNIGDYKSHTEHLSDLEDLAYRRMLDWYYLHETPLPKDVEQIARLIRMRSHTDCIAVVLREYFQETPEGWTSHRADLEIEHYRSKVEQASRAGKASAERRRNDRSTDVQPNIKQETITNKQETKKTATVVATPDGVSDSVWQDFVKHRKAKKAQVTQTVIDGIAKEAQKAGWTLEQALTECVVRGWQSFKADWVVAKQTFAQQAADVARTTVPARHSGPDPVLLKIEEDRQKAVPMPEHIRQQISKVLRKA